MFGPVDWAFDLLPVEPVERASKQPEPVMEANMFGPMDWAAEMEMMLERRDSVMLEAKA